MGSGGEWAASHLCRCTLGDKSSRYPLVGRLGAPQSQFGRCGVEIILLALSGIEPQSLGLPARSPSGMPDIEMDLQKYNMFSGFSWLRLVNFL